MRCAYRAPHDWPPRAVGRRDRRWSQLDELAGAPVRLEVPVPAPVGPLDAFRAQLAEAAANGLQLARQETVGVVKDDPVVCDVEQDPGMRAKLLYRVRQQRELRLVTCCHQRAIFWAFPESPDRIPA